MKIIIKDCFGKVEQVYKNEGNKYRALRVAQRIIVDMLMKNNQEDEIYTMSWKRVIGGYNIYDNFGGGLCYKIRISR